MNESKKIAIIGAGSWGSSLAMLAAKNNHEVILWSPDLVQVKTLTETRRNPILVATAPPLADNICPTTDLSRCIDADLTLIVVPSVAMRSVAELLKKEGLSSDSIVVSCTKGIEQGSHKLMSHILQEFLPLNPIGCLSGPNHAENVCLGLPSATLVGFEDMEYADFVQKTLSTSSFRIYTSHDIIGMQLGGAIKNVFAIASGLCEGLKLGDNAQAALVTRGLAEMRRLGTAYGGNPDTFMGLSGVGDLIVTCYSRHSRNQSVGQSIARGATLQQAVNSISMVAEGVPNTKSIHQMAHKAGVRSPLIDAVHSILYENKQALEVLSDLMTRDPRSEEEE